MPNHTYPILKFFKYKHLPERLQEVSKPFCVLAHAMAEMQTNEPAEMAAALRKLREAKDCAVCAMLE